MEKPTLSSSSKFAKDSSVFDSMLRSTLLSGTEKEEERIAQEAFVILVAGGETTAQVLTTATFHLLANKETALPRLKEELNSIMPDRGTRADLKSLEQLPWLVSKPTSYHAMHRRLKGIMLDCNSQGITSHHGTGDISTAACGTTRNVDLWRLECSSRGMMPL